jgi:hypothetical protein
MNNKSTCMFNVYIGHLCAHDRTTFNAETVRSIVRNKLAECRIDGAQINQAGLELWQGNQEPCTVVTIFGDIAECGSRVQDFAQKVATAMRATELRVVRIICDVSTFKGEVLS